MKTILVVYTNDKNATVEGCNNVKAQKYCFKTSDDVKPGDLLKSKSYNAPMLVTDVIETEYKYYNSTTGELSNEISSTRCYPIKTIELREESTTTIYAQKVTQG